jgi:hypothetical protein
MKILNLSLFICEQLKTAVLDRRLGGLQNQSGCGGGCTCMSVSEAF